MQYSENSTVKPNLVFWFSFFAQLETVFSVNVLQFIFLSLRLDRVILWSWVVSRNKLDIHVSFLRGSLPRVRFKNYRKHFWHVTIRKDWCFILQVVFVPMWIVLSLLCLLVLYYVIWSIIFVRTAEVLPAQRRGHVMVAVASVLLVIPLLTFQVCKLFLIIIKP